MNREMKIMLPFYKVAYAVSFVVILSLIRGVTYTHEVGLAIEAPFAILTAVFCADTYVQEIRSKRFEVHRLYPLKNRFFSMTKRLVIQELFLLLLAVAGYGMFFIFQKPMTHPGTKSEWTQFTVYFFAIAVTIFFWGVLANTLSMIFRNKLLGAWNLFSYSFRNIENVADFTWMYGKVSCLCIGLILLAALPEIIRKRG